MHDLNTINRLNAESAARQLGAPQPDAEALNRFVAEHRSRGAYVVASYTGIHLVSAAIYWVGRDAVDAFEWKRSNAKIGDRVELLAPTNIPNPSGKPVSLAAYIEGAQRAEGIGPSTTAVDDQHRSLPPGAVAGGVVYLSRPDGEGHAD